jgi:hypothetical protein
MNTGRSRRSRNVGGIRRTNGGRRLCIENLEQRLALTWAGVPPTSIIPPSTAVAVTLTSNDATGTASIASTEVDYYSFTAGASGSYTISATTPSSSLDTVLGVFSSTGQRLSYNDDISYPSNTDSRVALNLTAGTKYYVGITNYSSASLGSYTWTIDGPAVTTTPTDDAYENNDTLSTAYNLGTLASSRTVNPLIMADSADWFRFTTSATGTTTNTVSISFSNTQGNLQLALYNSSGAQIGSSLGTGNTETVSLNGLAAGTYYVDVFGASGAFNPNYSLTITPPTATTTPPPTGGFQITLQMSGLTATQQTIFQQAANRWAQVITGDLPNATYNGLSVDDLLINASATPIDGVGAILGQAGPDRLRSGSLLPYHGVMEFDSADLASMEQSGLLFSVVAHEMGHILGIGTIWQNLGLLSGAGTTNPIFVGANARAQYNQIFGTTASGVPVEATGGSGTRDSHWRESIMTSELMTGWAGPGTNLPLSRITVGSLADLGYTVNYAAADVYTPSSSSLTAARSASGAAAIRSFGILAGQDGVSSSTTPGFTSNWSSSSLPSRRSSLPVSHITPIDQDIADYALAASARTSASSQTTSDTSTDSTTSDDTSTDTCATDEALASLAADWNLWPTSAVA